MTDLLGRLSETNQGQILKYLRFFRQKKESLIRSLYKEFQELQSDSLTEDVYSKDDVEDYSKSVRNHIRSLIETEVGTLINMTSLAICQLLNKAQDYNVQLEMETDTIENQILLEAIEKMTLDPIANPKRGLGQLVSLKDEAKALKDESERVDQANRELKSQLDSMRRQLFDAERKLREFDGESKAGDILLNNRIKSLESQLVDAREENNKRVSDTIQFQQMKKLMQNQSSKIRDLRIRLNQYEPDNSKEDD